MLTCTSHAPTGPLIGIGLSARCLSTLKAGQPLVVHLSDRGLAPGKILVFSGHTEEEMRRELQTAHRADTIILVHRRTP